MESKPKPQPLNAGTPEPPAVENPSKLFAGQLANCIRRGLNPRMLADLALPAQGPLFVYGVSQTSAQAVAENFRRDAEAWKFLEPLGDRLETFLTGFIARCGEIVKEQGISAPDPLTVTHVCPYCHFESPLGGFTGKCPKCDVDTTEAVRQENIDRLAGTAATKANGGEAS